MAIIRGTPTCMQIIHDDGYWAITFFMLYNALDDSRNEMLHLLLTAPNNCHCNGATVGTLL